MRVDAYRSIRVTVSREKTAMKRRLLFMILLIIVLAVLLKYGVNATPISHGLPPDASAFHPS
jgi:hypothetical protein